MVFCGECGARDEGGKFCPECGAPCGQDESGLFGTASVSLRTPTPAPSAGSAISAQRIEAERKAAAAREIAEQAKQDAAKAAKLFEETEKRRLEEAHRLEEMQRHAQANIQRDEIAARQREAQERRAEAERQAEEARQRAIKVRTFYILRFSHLYTPADA
jgi:hypothetical protein